MSKQKESIELSKVEAGPSRTRPSSPRSPTIEAANIEKFERFKQEVGVTLSPTGATDSRSPTRSEFPPQPRKKTKLYEYNKIWRSNYTLSLGT
jgi:hypothetical protein